MSETPEFTTRAEFEKAIVKKAREDESFKKILMEKPHEAIAQFGAQASEEIEIRVVEESAKVVYLVLPLDLDELTNEQLDAVAAGCACPYCGCQEGLLKFLFGC